MPGGGTGPGRARPGARGGRLGDGRGAVIGTKHKTREGRLERRLKGLPLSEGVVVSRVCMFNDHRHNNLPLYKVDQGTGVEGEIERVKSAIRIAGERIESVRARVESAIGKAEAEIFVAQRMILEDRMLLERIMAPIESEHINAEAAVTQALDAFEERLRAVDDDYLRERATDFGEIKRRLLDVLSNMQPSLQCSEEHCQKGRDRVVVAEELTPSLTVEIDTGHIMGFVTERGGKNSHAAILARALGVPAVSGLAGLRNLVGCGCEILVNGNTGDVVIWPTEETVREAQGAHPEAVRKPAAVEPVTGLKVYANINLVSDVWEAVAMKAEGVGLYRTEMEVIGGKELPLEEELYEHYMSVVTAMDGRPVVFRMFDLGSDKPPAFLDIPREDNPALGWRGARLLLGRMDLFGPQARAIARVAQTVAVDVLYPMIVDLDQFRALRRAFRQVTRDLPGGVVRHGVMFEVPSACLEARAILEDADFASVGTNDLIQYLFAVDRNNELVAYDFRSDRSTLWRILETLVEAAHAAGKPISLCGELAGDPAYVRRLVELGVDSVSVSARRIPAVRHSVLKHRDDVAAQS